MDVKCERCSTEYEFDDALVSGRGTTVKCTNCGHKFKIRRSDGDFSEDFWNVTTGDGRTLVFTSLRELQRAIQSYLVERNDRLSRGGLPPKPIGQIPELAPFFEQRDAAKRNQQGRSVKTQDGLGPAAAKAAAEPAPPMRPRQATKPEFPAPPPSVETQSTGKATLLGPGGPSPHEEPSSAPSAPTPSPVASPSTEPVPTPPHVSHPPPVPRRESSNTVPIQRPTPPPPVPVAAKTTAVMSTPPPVPPKRSEPHHTPPPAPPRHDHASDALQHPPNELAETPLPPMRRRSLLAEIEEERDRVRGSSASDPGPPPRRSMGGFIVAAVVVACALTLGAVWAQKNLGVTLGTKPPPTPAPTVDPRVATFLTTGERALADGNLDAAKESFDKASALSEKDPHVLLDLARLAAVRADVAWLKTRLLPADATDDHRIATQNLQELGQAARNAADDALTGSPDDPAALRTKIDALRISGDREGARALVAKVTASGTQPEGAYVLAALDLAEPHPLWPTVVERLKTAASAETGPGRARAALIYALAQSGDQAGAKAEVERLRSMPRPHPLLPLLRDFADRAKTTLDAGVDAAIAQDIVDAGKVRVGGGGGGGGGGGLPSDPRELVAQGEKARAKGDYERARTLYSAALDKNPNDSEALAGLAQISYAQRDLAGARASYKRVLAINPNYMPALVGLADVEWESGDKATAAKMYKDIVDRYPDGTYPARVKQRLEGG